MKNKTKFSLKDIEDKISQLIFVAEVNLECCEVINNFLKEKPRIEYNMFLNQEEGKYLKLSLLNHFCESISIIHSLLHKSNKKYEELSFQLYTEKFVIEKCSEDKIKIQELESCLKNLWKKFDETSFSNIRDEICAHKDLENIGDPMVLTSLPINSKRIDNLQEILRELKDIAFKFFEDKTSFIDLIDVKQGLKNLLKKID